MPAWLNYELERGATIVTASRRLARALVRDHSSMMQARGLPAWASPAIVSIGRWQRELLDTLSTVRQAYCLSASQSRLLWEESLKAELGGRHAGLSAVVRAAIEAWQLIHAFEIPLGDIAQQIDSRDQGVFARAAARYAGRLEENGWHDDASLLRRLKELLDDKDNERLPECLVFAGFDRVTPALQSLMDRLQDRGTEIVIPETGRAHSVKVFRAAGREAEFRAAGLWARQRLQEDPASSIAIVVTGLERDPDKARRLIREGFAPGWQTDAAAAAAVNVSLGASLDSYPLIAVALLAIRWLHDSLTSRQLGVLLRCSFLGQESSDARARLELELRALAARDWTPDRFLRVFGRNLEDADTLDFLGRVEQLSALLATVETKAMPGQWAQTFDKVLSILAWPGDLSMNSQERQLLNRWHELLFEFAALDIVTGPIPLAVAAERLRALARETVYQPEDTGAVLSVLGPLEAAGLDFDALWLIGLDAERWPGAGNASPLISRQLQVQYGLPDSTPEDTLRFSRSVLRRIAASAPLVIGSYATHDGESELSPCLLEPLQHAGEDVGDPGWYVASLRASEPRLSEHDDRIPAVEKGERIRGGAGILDLQLREPFAAFAKGRLGVSPIDPFAEGLTPLLRGNLLHEALRRLYADLPAQAEIGAWSASELESRISEAARGAVQHYRYAAGATLERLLDFEEHRAGKLLRDVVAYDRERQPFRIQSVEGKSKGHFSGIELSLRHDRIDELPDGSIMILDYKTGAWKKFFEKHEPRDFQLVVYAAASEQAVGDLGLYNVDARQVGIDGAGLRLSGDSQFGAKLAAWKSIVNSAAAVFREGDVRVNIAQAGTDARWHALLSRFQELVRDV